MPPILLYFLYFICFSSMQHTKSLYRRFAILIFIGFPAERSPACIKYAVLQTNCGLVIVNDPNRFSFEHF
mgnify:CR=1 FL=1